MKKMRTMSRAMVALMLCCAIFTGTALAAGPQIIHAGDVTIISNAQPMMTRSAGEKHILINTSGNATYASPYKISKTAYPVNGNFMQIEVSNTSDVPLSVKITYTIEGKNYTTTEIVAAHKTYTTVSRNNTGNGLDLSFTMEINPQTWGQTGSFDIYAYQSWVNY